MHLNAAQSPLDHGFFSGTPAFRRALEGLAMSYEDDAFGTAAAKALIFPDGGHIGFGRDQETYAAIDSFLREIGYR